MGEKIERFTDLVTWQAGHTSVINIYEATSDFPSEEKFSLTSQIRRATVSITSNIAEGFGRQSAADKQHFYIMARDSVLELQNQLMIARDIGILSMQRFDNLLGEAIRVHRLLNGLIKSLKARE